MWCTQQDSNRSNSPESTARKRCGCSIFSPYRFLSSFSLSRWQAPKTCRYQTKNAHAEVILPSMSAFLAAVKFFAFDLLGRGGEGPDGTLLVVQLFSCPLAELFAGDEFRHEVHILSIIAAEMHNFQALTIRLDKQISVGLERF